LRCPFCYAPKVPGRLEISAIVRWAQELDGAGALGVGLGGGEPTAHPDFVRLCQQLTRETRLAVSFTTHGHRIDSAVADQLRGFVQFIRVSVDGTGSVYESARGRSFAALEERVARIAGIAPFGINTVVSRDTLASLDDVLEFAARSGARELLLLPERPTTGRPGLDVDGHARLGQWIREVRTQLRLTIAHGAGVADLPLADPFGAEPPLEAHAHVDARGVLRTDAYAATGVPVTGSILDALRALAERGSG
jgi:molybdenum cofactor biosynthesis enzyme MoaA